MTAGRCCRDPLEVLAEICLSVCMTTNKEEKVATNTLTPAEVTAKARALREKHKKRDGWETEAYEEVEAWLDSREVEA